MNEISRLLQGEAKIINVGAQSFLEDLKLQERSVLHVEWRPPAGGDVELVSFLDELENDERIATANQKVVEIMKSSHGVLVDMALAIDVIPGMDENTILHAGPPITWERMCGPMKGAVIGALLFEERASSEEAAIKLIESGTIKFSPCNEHNAVGPMAGIISPHMPVHIIKDMTHGNYAYCTVNEGLGKVLRYGAYDESVITRLKWIREEFYPLLKKVLALKGDGVDIKSLISQAVHMGDECHNRNKAATSLFFREVIPYFFMLEEDRAAVQRAVDFIRGNDHYFLNLSMPACKAACDAASNVDHATVVTTMARNGVDFGIRVSGMGKDTWFTAPADKIRGLLFPGFTEEDANPDIGDSTITETMGIGGFAMGGSPAIVQFVGGTVSDAIAYSEKMFTITTSENTNYSIPTLDFRGSAIGIDVMKVLATGTLPIINTGMAHKVAGVGQVGAGLVSPPMECFRKALRAYMERRGKANE
ncbi:DUF1116 domain-containing protein [Proteiniclasticum sp. SCR006]|uniref:DUF1116 domain-containing protein n=1 Tax=Proteiniclasticum aestuarii TaxID=2817862 RepID=A0A939H6I4_9CLOT|nr:DUF1116 domain-containing protein [Proteiniclasticum aestuarii]MBO1264021.1 DUF1116 domain-containing protein [Proteiniclasticum aestuarii]